MAYSNWSSYLKTAGFKKTFPYSIRQPLTYSIDAFLTYRISVTYTTQSYLLKTQPLTYPLESLILKTQTKTHLVDALIQKTQTKTHSIDADLNKPETSTHSIDADLFKTLTNTHSIDTSIVNRLTKTHLIDESIVLRKTTTHSLTAFLVTIDPTTNPIVYNFDTGSNGAQITTSDTGALSTIAPVVADTGMVYSNTQSFTGSLSATYAGSTSGVKLVWGPFNGYNGGTNRFLRYYVRFAALPSSASDLFMSLYGGQNTAGVAGLTVAGNAIPFTVSASGVVQADGTDTGVVFSINTWYRIEVIISKQGATNYSYQFYIYEGDSVSPIGSYFATVDSNTNTLIFYGKNGQTSQRYFDGIELSAVSPIGPVTKKLSTNQAAFRLYQTAASISNTTIFGGTAGSGESNQAISQSWTATISTINSVSFWTSIFGSPSDNLYVVVTSSAGGTAIATSNTVAGSGMLINSKRLAKFTFASPVSLTIGNKYLFEIYRDGVRSAVNYYELPFNAGAAGDTYSGGGIRTRTNNSWGSETAASDIFFEVEGNTGFNIDSLVLKTQTNTHSIDVDLFKTLTKTHSIDSLVLQTKTLTHSIDESIVNRRTKTHSVNAFIATVNLSTTPIVYNFDTGVDGVQITTSDTGTNSSVAPVSVDTGMVYSNSQSISPSLSTTYTGTLNSTDITWGAWYTTNKLVFLRAYFRLTALSIGEVYIQIGNSQTQVGAGGLSGSGDQFAKTALDKLAFGGDILTHTALVTGQWYRIELAEVRISATSTDMFAYLYLENSSVPIGGVIQFGNTWTNALTLYGKFSTTSQKYFDSIEVNNTGLPGAFRKTLGANQTAFRYALTGSSNTALAQLLGGTASSGQTQQARLQEFTATFETLNSIGLWVRANVSPTDNIYIAITTSRGGTPIATSNTIAGTSLTTADTLQRFTFSSPVSLTIGNTYNFEVYRDGARDGTNFYSFQVDTGATYSGGGTYLRSNNTWSSVSSIDFVFEVEGNTGVNIDSLILKTQTKTHSIDSLVLKTQTKTHSIDSLILKTQTKTCSIDSLLKKTQTQTCSVDSLLKKTETSTQSVDSLRKKTVAFSSNFILEHVAFTQLNSSNLFGGTAGSGETRQALAQSFTVKRNYTSTKMDIRMGTNGSPVDNVFIDITTSLGGTPLATSSLVPGSSISSDQTVTFTFITPVALSTGTTYFVEMYRDGTRSLANDYSWASNSVANTHADYPDGSPWIRDNNAWVASTDGDRVFVLFADNASLIDTSIVNRRTKTHSVDASIVIATSSQTITHQIDALILQTFTKTHSVDSLLQKTETSTHEVDGLLKKTETSTHSVDSLLNKTETSTHQIDSLLKKTETSTHQIDADLKKTETSTHAITALLDAIGMKFHAIDVDLFKTLRVTHLIDALTQYTFTKTHSIDSLIQKTQTKTHSVDSLLDKTETSTHSIDSLLRKTETSTHQIDSDLKKTESSTHLIDSLILKTAAQTHSIDSLLRKTETSIHQVDADLKKTETSTHLVDSLLTTGTAAFCVIDSLLRKTFSVTHSVDALVQKTFAATYQEDALLRKTETKTYQIDSLIKKTQTKTCQIDSLILKTQSATYNVDTLLANRRTQTCSVDALIQRRSTQTYQIDGLIKKTTSSTYTEDALVQKTSSNSHSVDALIQNRFAKTYSVNALLLKTEATSTAIDSLTQQTRTKTYAIDGSVYIRVAVSHSIDVFLRQGNRASQNVDALLRKTSTVTQGIDFFVGEIPTIHGEPGYGRGIDVDPETSHGKDNLHGHGSGGITGMDVDPQSSHGRDELQGDGSGGVTGSGMDIGF